MSGTADYIITDFMWIYILPPSEKMVRPWIWLTVCYSEAEDNGFRMNL